jgi:hypothetical protein
VFIGSSVGHKKRVKSGMHVGSDLHLPTWIGVSFFRVHQNSDE